MMNSLEDILKLDGIVIRNIPKTTKSIYYSYDPKTNKRLKETIVKTNELAGWIITFELSQDATIRFNKKCNGVGKTIEKAYQDYLSKAKKLALVKA